MPDRANETSWVNWGGNQRASSAEVARPQTDDEAVAVVRSALRRGSRIRAAGSGHSFSALVPTDGLILDTTALTGIVGVDRERRRVRLRGGTRISDIGEALWEHGLALANQGDIDRQTIAGAVATGTHGSGIALGSLSSMVRGTRLIDGTGQIQEIGEDDPERLRAAQVALGVLGVVLEVEIEVAEAYHLEEHIDYPDWDEVQRTAAEDLAAYQHFSYLWMPHPESAALYELAVPEGATPGEACYRKRYRLADIREPEGLRAEPGSRIDRSYRIYPDSFDLRFHELEYFVDSRHGAEAVVALRDLMRTAHPEQRYPLEVRWVRGDPAFLSPTGGRDCVVLSVSGAPGTDYGPYLRDVHRMLAGMGGRPHWGKLHFFERHEVEAAFPELDAFLAVRADLDPDRAFANAHTDAVLG